MVLTYGCDAVSIPGPPLSAQTPLQALLGAGVTVAVGTTSVDVTQAWDVHHMRFNLGWVCSISYIFKYDSNSVFLCRQCLTLMAPSVRKRHGLFQLQT